MIAGPARSGTTILHELLWLDPDARSPLGYESLQPVPPAGLTGDAHRRVAECEQELWADVQPEFAAIHELAAHLPMECIAIRQPLFAGFHWPMIAHIPGYVPDFPAAMNYHRAVLQSLQYGAPKRTWVFKTPVYMMMLDLLYSTYPDASVIITHRDPVKTITSGLSTIAAVRWLRSDDVDLESLNGAGSGLLLYALWQRDQAGTLPGPLVHVHFADLMRDPVGAMERLYDDMGPAVPGRARRQDPRIPREQAQGQVRRAQVHARGWGLDPQRIRSDLAPYMEYYRVARED